MGLLLKSIKENQEKDFLSKVTVDKECMSCENLDRLTKRLMIYKTAAYKKEGQPNGVQ